MQLGEEILEHVLHHEEMSQRRADRFRARSDETMSLEAIQGLHVSVWETDGDTGRAGGGFFLAHGSLLRSVAAFF
jgi:hypothetical protein